MKSKLFILILALSNSIASIACSYFGDSPKNYKYYRVSEQTGMPRFTQPSYVQRNILSWQKQSAGRNFTYPLEDIKRVVYHYSIEDMMGIVYHDRIPHHDPYNGFAVWLTQRTLYAKVLLIAKQVENARAEQNDPWYYPSARGEGFHTLEQLLDEIETEERRYTVESEDTRYYLHRYMLQRIRILFSLGKYEECIHLWISNIQNWPEEDLMRTMIKDYIAGAYAHAGDTSTAQEMYLEQGNLWALADLAQANGSGDYAILIRAVYDVNPDCAELIAPALQYELQNIGQDYFDCEKERTKCAKYYDLMKYIISSHRSKDMALWYYTAAFLEDRLGQSQQAAQTIRLAANCATTPYMQTNIHYMRIYLDAKTKPYNAAYEQQLLTDIKWMDNQVRKNLPDMKQNWREYSCWDVWMNFSNIYANPDAYSIYYSYNILRKIILGVMASRMKEVGKQILSIELTNYADNLLFTLIDPDKRHCFFNDCFMAMDTIPATTVEQYAQCALNPHSELERLLAKGSYRDKDYLYDIVGTLYLREGNYKKAMENLSKVSPKYQFRLNTNYNLCAHDPFGISTGADREGQLLDCKYNFASQMYALEQIFNNPQIDPNRRADAMLNYTIGYERSFLASWGLTQYGQGQPVFTYAYESWLTTQRKKQVLARSKRLRKEAYSLYTNDEARAAAELRCLNTYTVITKYPNTAAAEYVRSHCDTYYDYHPEYK